MRKRFNYIFVLFIFLSSLFLFQNNINAEYSGTGGSGNGNVSGISGSGNWSSKFGFYIKVYDKNDKQRGGTVSVDTSISGWISSSNGTWTSNPDKLYDYLNIPYGSTSGNYSTLLSKINVTLNVGDYITIEPYTMIDGEKYTFRTISDSTKTYPECTETKCASSKCVEYNQACAKEECTKEKCTQKKCTKKECTKEKCTKKFLGICIKKECTKEKCTKEKCTKTECTATKCVEYKNTTCKTSECTQYECSKTTNHLYSVWYARPAVILSNAAKVGSTIKAGGKTFTAPSANCTTSTYGAKKFCGYSSNKNIGYGITVVRYSDIYNNYTVTYNANGGTGAPASQTKEHGVDLILSSTKPTRSGYTFVNWNTNSSGTGTSYNSGGKYTSNSNLTLYAQWVPQEFSVIYHGEEGYTNDGKMIVIDPLKYNEYYTVRGADLFSKDNYIFIGWTTKSDGTSDSTNECGGIWCPGWTGSWVYTNGQFGIENNVLNLYARWQDSCISRFGQQPTILQRLSLYKDLTKEITDLTSPERRSLLNFKIHDAETSCGNYTPDYQSKSTCLETDQVNIQTKNNFTHENLSDYNDTITASSGQGQSYCLTNFELTKGSTVIYDSNAIVKAGTMVFKIDKDAVVATGTLTKTCYIHESEYNNYNDYTKAENPRPIINIDEYIGKITLAGVDLNSEVIPSPLTITKEGEFHKVEGSVTIKYKPNPVYVEKISGDFCKEADKETDKCRVIGYGVASKFNDVNKLDPSFNFLITESTAATAKNIFDFTKTTDSEGNKVEADLTCKYKVESEVITYNSEKPKGKLQIEFRVIDTKKPFNRNPKSNWKGINNDTGKSKVQEEIIDSNNSYNKTGVGSLYQTEGMGKIILTPDIVQKIRKYNDGTGEGVCANENPSYNDYTVYTEVAADGTETTTSNFFKCIGLTKVS